MAKKKQGDRVARIVADVEKAAKRLRADVRKRVTGAPLLKTLQKAAGQLRDRAAKAAGQVEKYVHEIRMELESAQPAAGRARRPSKRKKL
jgi:hypothetical protein